MKSIALTLTGFCGIRDGLGRETVTLNFEELVGDAQLVALVAGNGRGKTTLLDNMHPYAVMPSRAGADGLGAFSYYDQVYLPENEKIYDWEMEGRRLRSHMVIRMNGKRRTEAFLHAWNGGRWVPERLADGTVSDGRMDTYTRCVEAILGSAETFLTTAFSAQGKRQLSAYKNAEIKVLLGDLLGLERIRQLGAQAAETARLIKAGLFSMRHDRTKLQVDQERTTEEIARFADCERRADAARLAKFQCIELLDKAKEKLLTLSIARDAAREQEVRRAHLMADRQSIIASGKAALASLDAQDSREQARLAQLEQRVAQRAAARDKDRNNLAERQARLRRVVEGGRHVARATRRAPLLRAIAEQRARTVEALQSDVATLERIAAQLRFNREKIAGLEREAGQAALKTGELRRRYGLTAEVPCAGTALQGRCQLLGDAHAAKELLPSADREVERIAGARRTLLAEARENETQAAALGGAVAALGALARKLNATRARLHWEEQLATRQDEINRAVESLAEVETQIAELALDAAGTAAASAETETERAQIAALRGQFRAKRGEESARHRQALDRVDAAILALPAPFEEGSLTLARSAVEAAQAALARAEEGFLAAVRDQQRLAGARERAASLNCRLGVCDSALKRVEGALGDWSLFAKCMSNDGLIALDIDDAGPELSALANDLLRACFGRRFTATLITQVQTTKGELREDFDVVVHDAFSDSTKSLEMMSGGERVWINEALTRAMALYLASGAGRHSETLFSDEADGAFDPSHKRMFIAMKREVLRIGGYRQEFFISHTPELAAMADAVIDLDRYADPSFGGPAPVAGIGESAMA